MAITYPLDLPDVGLASITLSAHPIVAVHTSIFTHQQDVTVFPGQRWEVEFEFARRNRKEAQAITAWLTALNGRQGTFLMGDPFSADPLGAASGTPGSPVVDGGSQTGDSLDIKGAPASVTDYLKAGDYIQLGTGSDAHLHQVLEDVDTNASGEATLTIWPDLRESPSDGDAVVVSDTKGLWRLAANVNGWSIVPPSLTTVSLQAVEVL